MMHFIALVPAFSATVFAIMKIQTANSGPARRYSGRSGDALRVELTSEVFDLKPTSQKQNEEREKRWNRPRRDEAGIP
ncbi:MAG: hypothetical protein MUC50_08880, partial [Myxococcota bacterium]|nr:hypothetical protein [Myxococcota bacterium]